MDIDEENRICEPIQEAVDAALAKAIHSLKVPLSIDTPVSYYAYRREHDRCFGEFEIRIEMLPADYRESLRLIATAFYDMAASLNDQLKIDKRN